MKAYDKVLRAMVDHIAETGTFKGYEVCDVRLDEDPGIGSPNIEVETVEGSAGVWLYLATWQLRTGMKMFDVVTAAHERGVWEEHLEEEGIADRYFGPVFEIETTYDYCVFLYPQKYAVKFKLLGGLEPWDQVDVVGVPDQMINKMARSLERLCTKKLYRG